MENIGAATTGPRPRDDVNNGPHLRDIFDTAFQTMPDNVRQTERHGKDRLFFLFI